MPWNDQRSSLDCGWVIHARHDNDLYPIDSRVHAKRKGNCELASHLTTGGLQCLACLTTASVLDAAYVCGLAIGAGLPSAIPRVAYIYAVMVARAEHSRMRKLPDIEFLGRNNASHTSR